MNRVLNFLCVVMLALPGLSRAGEITFTWVGSPITTSTYSTAGINATIVLPTSDNGFQTSYLFDSRNPNNYYAGNPTSVQVFGFPEPTGYQVPTFLGGMPNLQYFEMTIRLTQDAGDPTQYYGGFVITDRRGRGTTMALNTGPLETGSLNSAYFSRATNPALLTQFNSPVAGYWQATGVPAPASILLIALGGLLLVYKARKPA
jgi:hypothetical protein